MFQNNKLILKIVSDDEKLIYEAKDMVVNAGGQAGNPDYQRWASDLKFDPTNAIFNVYTVLGILATIGGAIQFVEWLVGKAKSFKSGKLENRIIVICNDKTIVVSKDSDIQTLYSQLKQLLALDEDINV